MEYADILAAADRLSSRGLKRLSSEQLSAEMLASDGNGAANVRQDAATLTPSDPQQTAIDGSGIQHNGVYLAIHGNQLVQTSVDRTGIDLHCAVADDAVKAGIDGGDAGIQTIQYIQLGEGRNIAVLRNGIQSIKVRNSAIFEANKVFVDRLNGGNHILLNRIANINCNPTVIGKITISEIHTLINILKALIYLFLQITIRPRRRYRRSCNRAARTGRMIINNRLIEIIRTAASRRSRLIKFAFGAV